MRRPGSLYHKFEHPSFHDEVDQYEISTLEDGRLVVGRCCKSAMQRPWNPFDAAGDRVNFPDIEAALSPGVGTAATVDIAAAAATAALDAAAAQPELGHLPEGTSEDLEAQCQAWFDQLQRAKAAGVSRAPRSVVDSGARSCASAWCRRRTPRSHAGMTHATSPPCASHGPANSASRFRGAGRLADSERRVCASWHPLPGPRARHLGG